VNTEVKAKPDLSSNELRAWAEERLSDCKTSRPNRTSTLADRQFVESFVDRVESNPDEKTGVVLLHADLESGLLCTRVVSGKDRTRVGSEPLEVSL
jgi:hypothetical protein